MLMSRRIHVREAKKKLRAAKSDGARISQAAEANGTKPLPVRSPVKNEQHAPAIGLSSPSGMPTQTSVPPKRTSPVALRLSQQAAHVLRTDELT